MGLGNMAALTTARGVVWTQARLSGLESDQGKPVEPHEKPRLQEPSWERSSSQTACAVKDFFFFFKMRHLGACLGTDENYPVGRIIRGQPLIRRKARPAHLETHGARGQCRDQSSPGGHAPCPLLSVLPQLNILQTGRWLFNRKLAAVT